MSALARTLCAAIIFLIFATGAHAQTVICPVTPDPATSNQVCANTAFVHGAINAIPATPLAPIANNNFLANTSGGTAAPVATTTSAFFDSVCSTTIGQFWVRMTGGWGCTALGFINPIWYGAKGDCTTDDSTAIQAAINALTIGGEVFFPTPPGGCYAIGLATVITLPTAVSISLVGADRYSTILQAQGSSVTWAGADGIINTFGSNFFRGNRIANMTLDGNNIAPNDLSMAWAQNATFENLNLVSATVTNFILGDGTNNVQENVLNNIKIDNPIPTTLAGLPTYDIEIKGTNNYFMNIKASNAKTANWHDAPGSGGNYFVNIHGYDFFNGAAQAPTYNFLIEGAQEFFVNWEADGASTADVQITGFSNVLTAGLGQFDQVTAEIGVQFATATSANLVYGNQFSSNTGTPLTDAHVVVQAGSAAGHGNYNFFNYNDASGNFGAGGGANDGVTCAAGFSASAGRSFGGIVTHC